MVWASVAGAAQAQLAPMKLATHLAMDTSPWCPKQASPSPGFDHILLAGLGLVCSLGEAQPAVPPQYKGVVCTETRAEGEGTADWPGLLSLGRHTHPGCCSV